jgi:hypothetical protein
MKDPTTPQEPLCTFKCPHLDYSILLVPHSAEARTNFTLQAKTKHMSLREFARDEILSALTMSQID